MFTKSTHPTFVQNRDGDEVASDMLHLYPIGLYIGKRQGPLGWITWSYDLGARVLNLLAYGIDYDYGDTRRMADYLHCTYVPVGGEKHVVRTLWGQFRTFTAHHFSVLTDHDPRADIAALTISRFVRAGLLPVVIDDVNNTGICGYLPQCLETKQIIVGTGDQKPARWMGYAHTVVLEDIPRSYRINGITWTVRRKTNAPIVFTAAPACVTGG